MARTMPRHWVRRFDRVWPGWVGFGTLPSLGQGCRVHSRWLRPLRSARLPGDQEVVKRPESLAFSRRTRERCSGTILAKVFACSADSWGQEGSRNRGCESWYAIGGDTLQLREPHPLKRHVVHPRTHLGHRLVAWTCFVLHVGRVDSHPTRRCDCRCPGPCDPGSRSPVTVERGPSGWGMAWCHRATGLG
jgi:hypothetical protein